MFKGNAKLIIKKLTSYDKFGGAVFTSSDQNVKCSVVKMNVLEMDTSPRMNLSASVGNSNELQVVGTILVGPSTDIGIGDQLLLNGLALKVSSVFNRSDVDGKPHHIEVGCSIWA
jgi:hypothetical protein